MANSAATAFVLLPKALLNSAITLSLVNPNAIISVTISSVKLSVGSILVGLNGGAAVDVDAEPEDEAP